MRLYDWWKARILEHGAAMTDQLAAEAVRERERMAGALIDDLTHPENVLEFVTSRFKFKARVLHAEQWIAADGAVSVQFRLETAGAPVLRDAAPQEGWKP